jgi:hypothetical protein
VKKPGDHLVKRPFLGEKRRTTLRTTMKSPKCQN